MPTSILFVVALGTLRTKKSFRDAKLAVGLDSTLAPIDFLSRTSIVEVLREAVCRYIEKGSYNCAIFERRI